MTKIFRWKGLIPFALIVGVLWVGGWLFADTIARQVLVSSLTRIQGAQVDIGSADVSWRPMGIVVTELAFTDPNQPRLNAFEIEQAAWQMDGLGLLTGKVVIEALAVDGLRFGTERATPGRVRAKPAVDPSAPREPSLADRAADTVDLPSPREALNRHGGLLTDERGDQLQDTWSTANRQIIERAAALPDDESLASHRARLRAIQNTSFDSLAALQGAQQEIQQLSRAVAQDRQSIDRFLNTLDSSEDEVRAALAALIGAPAEDWAAILSTYNLSPEAQVALVGLLMGEQWSDWLAQGQYWYAQAEPWIQRLMDHRRASAEASAAARRSTVTGYYVFFPEDNPQPRFWLKDARVNAYTATGDWRARLSDVSTNHAMIGRPARLEANSTVLDAADSAELSMVWDMRTGNRLDLDLGVRQWQISGWQLSNPEYPLGLRRSSTDLRVTAGREGRWDGNLAWQFGAAEFGIPASWGSGNVMRRALESVDGFAVESRLSGSGLFPRMDWSSNLDDQLRASIRGQFSAELARWQGEVEAELAARRAAFEAPIRAELAQLQAQRREWEQKKNDLEREVVDTLAALERQMVGRVDTLESQLDAERRAAEQRLREEQQRLEQQAEDERKRLEQQAEDERRRLQREAEQRARDALRNRSF
ncbi:TIGR03545 family protein [Salinispirillum sp. LH 10-3-1]|uniref:TIGR03545 family protein n=1 Tax=Salinispirillum sp. LH 10-3-1 TaxID=2952525 RepID=A0AB38YIR0_9GAMM